jgi:hypothetical protein
MFIEDEAEDEIKRLRLNVRLLPPGEVHEDDGPPTIVIEGDAESLRYLADAIHELLQDEDCGIHLMACQFMFSKDTQYDLYLHRLPCINDLLKAAASETREPDSDPQNDIPQLE